MRFVFYTNVVSPHQLPLARELVSRLGEEEYRYVHTEPLMAERRDMGWSEENCKWILPEWESKNEARYILKTAEVLMSENRDLGLFELRAKNGLKTIYESERWFKPNKGILRLLSPSYFRMAWRFVKLLRNSDCVYYYPMGIHAAKDIARLCGLFAGDLRCLFRSPRLDFERKAGGRIWLKTGGEAKKYCLDKMRMWGYYVEPAKFAISAKKEQRSTSHEIKVLWVGRLLNLKRVDTIVRAVSAYADLKRENPSLPKIILDIYGIGPEEARLKKMAARNKEVILFHPPVPIEEVRKLMREHDVYVLSSNAFEGWGAVVSEALEEGMSVISTYEAGSGASMLPAENLFHAGDWRKLLKLLQYPIKDVGIGKWTARKAAEFLINEPSPERWRKVRNLNCENNLKCLRSGSRIEVPMPINGGMEELR